MTRTGTCRIETKGAPSRIVSLGMIAVFTVAMLAMPSSLAEEAEPTSAEAPPALETICEFIPGECIEPGPLPGVGCDVEACKTLEYCLEDRSNCEFVGPCEGAGCDPCEDGTLPDHVCGRCVEDCSPPTPCEYLPALAEEPCENPCTSTDCIPDPCGHLPALVEEPCENPCTGRDCIPDPCSVDPGSLDACSCLETTTGGPTSCLPDSCDGDLVTHSVVEQVACGGSDDCAGDGEGTQGGFGVDGTSQWSIGAIVEACAISVVTPMVPAYVDTGSVSAPYTVTPGGDWTSCTYNDAGNNGWEFTVWAEASIRDAAYGGGLPFGYSASFIGFDLEEKAYETPHVYQKFDGAPGDQAERALCETTRAVMLGNAMAEAWTWVQAQLDSHLLVPCTGSLQLVPMAGGGYLLSTGDMPGTCELSFDAVTHAWSFSATFLLPQGHGVTVVVKVHGESFFVSPTVGNVMQIVNDWGGAVIP